jgi:ketosteroid isomerase-like protein
MASHNVDLVRRMYLDFLEGREPPRSAFGEDVEWHGASDLPDRDTHRGYDGVAAYVADWIGSFEEFTADIKEFIDRGEYVVAALVLRGRVTGRGDDVSLPETHVWRIRDGLVVEVREYRTLELALEALEAP